ncbi:MAG: hypothetical protein ABH851_09425 [Methanobacteriota archaeon]
MTTLDSLNVVTTTSVLVREDYVQKPTSKATTQKASEEDARIKECEVKDNVDKDRDICFMNAGFFDEDPSYCMYIEDAGVKNQCYNNIAVNVGDPTICASISDRYWGSQCVKYAGEKRDKKS